MTDPVVGDLLDTDAVAKLAKVSSSTIYTYRSRGEVNFPAPLTHFGQAPVWRRSDIEAWLAGRPGRGGRPRADKDVGESTRAS